MKTIFTNISLIFKNPRYIFGYFFLVILLTYLWYSFTDFPLMKGNYGMTHYWYDGIISWINILTFPLFIVAWIYRSYTLGSYSNAGEKAGFLGGMLGIIISGSACCGTSILLALGTSALSNIISNNPYLPFRGLELKTLGAIILIWALCSLLKNLLICKKKNSTKKSSK